MKDYTKYLKWPQTNYNDIICLLDAYRHAYWSWHGIYEQKFLKEFCKYTNAKYGIMTTSGTAAIEASLAAINIKEGDEVIVPAITWITTATIVSHMGAIPVIVDVDKDTLCISPKAIEQAINRKTKAIIIVHIYSSVCEIDKIVKIAKENNISIIEDCAQAHGAKYKGNHVGTFGDIGIFSFQQSKLITAGEGGICITNNLELAKRIEKYTHVGDFFEKDCEILENNLKCKKYVLTEFQSAILYSQLMRFTNELNLRAKNAEIIKDILQDVDAISIQNKGENTTTQTFYILPLLLNFQFLKPLINRNIIIDSLRENGIPVGIGIGTTIYNHRLWNIEKTKYVKKEIIYADDIAKNRLISIFHPLLLMKEHNVREMANTIKKIILSFSK